ncbi:MAG: nucleotidyl transferase AbiEii/AbiGii toxin family protein [Bacillota bacterium]
MKEHLRSLVVEKMGRQSGVNIAREYLQARILAALQRAGAMVPLAFHGGTALRFLFGSERFSEDLDFALEREPALYDFRAYLKSVKDDLTRQGYRVEVKVNDQKTVHSAFIRFPGLLFDLGLSPHRGQTLSIKIEVDTNPPAGAGLATSLIRRHVLLRLQHHDRASLLAGKIHAILQRPYVKGRDLYDLLWYLSDRSWPEPNLVMLRNALAQTGWTGEAPTEGNWRSLVATRLREVDWERARADVAPFLPEGFDPALLSMENLMALLQKPAPAREGPTPIHPPGDDLKGKS